MLLRITAGAISAGKVQKTHAAKVQLVVDVGVLASGDPSRTIQGGLWSHSGSKQGNLRRVRGTPQAGHSKEGCVCTAEGSGNTTVLGLYSTWPPQKRIHKVGKKEFHYLESSTDHIEQSQDPGSSTPFILN